MVHDYQGHMSHTIHNILGDYKTYKLINVIYDDSIHVQMDNKLSMLIYHIPTGRLSLLDNLIGLSHDIVFYANHFTVKFNYETLIFSYGDYYWANTYIRLEDYPDFILEPIYTGMRTKSARKI